MEGAELRKELFWIGGLDSGWLDYLTDAGMSHGQDGNLEIRWVSRLSRFGIQARLKVHPAGFVRLGSNNSHSRAQVTVYSTSLLKQVEYLRISVRHLVLILWVFEPRNLDKKSTMIN